ncbi:unnamed protein product [Rotaria sp. Silwood2]|nr:unnamed protein product [Rotaria sp. Silwood2]
MLVNYKVQSSLDMAYCVLHERNIKLALTKLNVFLTSKNNPQFVTMSSQVDIELRITSGNFHCDNKSFCIRSRNKSRVIRSS